MLDGVMLLWFLLAAASLVFVAIDIRSTPESPVMKWGFVLLTAYTGVIWRLPLRPWAAASPCPGRTSSTRRRSGDRRWDRPCIASPATVSASWPAR